MKRPPRRGPSVSLTEFVKLLIDSKMEEVHTMMPGRVVEFYPATHCVDVKPLLKEPIFDECQNRISPDDYPVLADVPIRYPGGGGFMITWPLEIGDSGMIEFCEANLAGWLTTGEECEPEFMARHHLSNATFVPDFWARHNITDVISEAMRIGSRFTGQQLRIDADTVEACAAGATAVDFVALAGKVDALIKQVTDLLTGEGTLPAKWVVPGSDGGAALQAAAKALWPTAPSTVASSNLKAD